MLNAQQQYQVLQKLGYEGSPQQDEMELFIKASPRASAVMGKASALAGEILKNRNVVAANEGTYVGTNNTNTIVGDNYTPQDLGNDMAALYAKGGFDQLLAKGFYGPRELYGEDILENWNGNTVGQLPGGATLIWDNMSNTFQAFGGDLKDGKYVFPKGLSLEQVVNAATTGFTTETLASGATSSFFDESIMDLNPAPVVQETQQPSTEGGDTTGDNNMAQDNTGVQYYLDQAKAAEQKLVEMGVPPQRTLEDVNYDKVRSYLMGLTPEEQAKYAAPVNYQGDTISVPTPDGGASVNIAVDAETSEKILSDMENLGAEIEYKENSPYKAYQDAVAQQQQAAAELNTAVGQGQRDVVAGAMTDPASVATTADVANIPVTPDQQVAEGTGQVTGLGMAAAPADLATTKTVDRAGDVGSVYTTSYTADTGAADALKKDLPTEGATQQKPSEEVDRAVASLPTGADIEAPGLSAAEKQALQATAGERTVGAAEQAQAKLMKDVGDGKIPEAKAATYMAEVPEAKAAAFNTKTPEAIAKDYYNLTSAAYATQAATAVQAAAKATETPQAQEQQSLYRSELQAELGLVAKNELIDPEKQKLLIDKVVEAPIVAMRELDEKAVAVAQRGDLSQYLAKAQEGTVSAKATVQGQLGDLMAQFDNGTPAWAAGAIRAANQAMIARGMGGSSMAGAAIVQAAMESALPIAQADAQVFATMDFQNLSNRQAVALANAAAQQGMELANLNNEQQAMLANANNSFALQQQNLSNEQATVLANAQFKAAVQMKNIDTKTQASLVNAARYAEINNINLNNKQQAAIQRSSENLQLELADLSNAQQTALANLQVRAALVGQELDNEQQVAMLTSTQAFERAGFDASAKQQAFMQDAAAQAALEGRALDARQQTQLFNVSAKLEERQIELNNRQQTNLFNSTNKLTVGIEEMGNRQQSDLANAQINAAIREQELSNAQQVAIINASNVFQAANLEYSAEQEVALANSQLMATIESKEMDAKLSAAIANAANLVTVEKMNVDAVMQANIANAANFLQLDLANLNNLQQQQVVNAQLVQQAILSDQAAANAQKQFNASSSQQVDMFMAGLKRDIAQFNASQQNAMAQFEVSEENALAKFNAEQQNARDQFNATNSLLVAQSNAQWRQSVATADTAAQNMANMEAAKAANLLTDSMLNEIWQRERDMLSMAWKSSENTADRANAIIMAEMEIEARDEALDKQAAAERSAAAGAALYQIGSKLIFGW